MRLFLIIIISIFSLSVGAHHSAVMFDFEQTVTKTGVVKEFQYSNPHSWLIVDISNEDGSVTTWGFEAEGPSTLIRGGIRKSDLKPGTRVTVTANPMRDGRPAGAWSKVVREGDKKAFFAKEGFKIK